jgi:hypothetical protein
MRKFYGLMLALLSVSVVGAHMASVAFAESEWLVNGAVISAAEDLHFTLKGEVLLEDTGAPGKPDILCTGALDGLFESGTLAFINEVLDSSGELLAATIKDLSSTVEGDDVECTDMSGTCSGVVLLVALHLPTHVELELLVGDAEEPYMADALEEAGKEPAYAIDCNSLLGLVEDVCDGLATAFLLDLGAGDVTVGVLAIKQGNCSLGGIETSVLEGEALLEDTDSPGSMFSLS